jgi:hypothetical protein
MLACCEATGDETQHRTSRDPRSASSTMAKNRSIVEATAPNGRQKERGYGRRTTRDEGCVTSRGAARKIGDATSLDIERSRPTLSLAAAHRTRASRLRWSGNARRIDQSVRRRTSSQEGARQLADARRQTILKRRRESEFDHPGRRVHVRGASIFFCASSRVSPGLPRLCRRLVSTGVSAAAGCRTWQCRRSPSPPSHPPGPDRRRRGRRRPARCRPCSARSRSIPAAGPAPPPR